MPARNCSVLRVSCSIHADQVRQAHVQAYFERQQVAVAPFPLPTRRQAVLPVDRRALGRQERFKSLQNALGTLQKSHQSRVQGFSSCSVMNKKPPAQADSRIKNLPKSI
jgi:hypothetical protein